MNELHLFAGAGGGILAGQMLGHRCVCAVECEPYAAGVLIARQNDGSLPPFPVWDDVQTFDGRPWRGIVDIVAGGFPCQDISVAGKGAGIEGARSGMWSHMARIVGEVRPRFVFVENSPALLTRGLGVVLSDLAALGYDCRWTVLGAADVGAPHRRDRFWLVGRSNAGSAGRERGRCADDQSEGPNSFARLGSDVSHAYSKPSTFRGFIDAVPQACRCWSDESGRSRRNVPRIAYAASNEALADAHGKRAHGAWTCGARGAEPTDSGIDVADSDSLREPQPQGCECDKRGRPCDCGAEGCHADSARLAQRQGQPSHARQELAAIERADWWQSEPNVGGSLDGLAPQLDATCAADIGGR